MRQSLRKIRALLWAMGLGMAFLMAGCGSDNTFVAPETEAPTAEITTPIQDATGIPINPLLEVVFDTVMDPTSINEDTIYLIADGTDDVIKGTVELLEDGVTAVFTATEPLIPGQLYNLVVSTGVADITGNHLLSNVLSDTISVGDTARIVTPVVMSVAEPVVELLGSEQLALVNSVLGSLLGLTESLAFSAQDLVSLSNAELPLLDILSGVQELIPGASTVGDVLSGNLSLAQLLNVVSSVLGSTGATDVQNIVNGLLGSLPADLLGQVLSLGDFLQLPTDLLGLEIGSGALSDALTGVALDPLTLVNTVAQLVNSLLGGVGTLVPVEGESLISSVLAQVGDLPLLSLVGGELVPSNGLLDLTYLVPSELLGLIGNLGDVTDPVGLLEGVVDELAGGVTDLVSILTGLLGGGQEDLVNALAEALGGLDDPQGLLESLLDLVGQTGLDPLAILQDPLGAILGLDLIPILNGE